MNITVICSPNLYFTIINSYNRNVSNNNYDVIKPYHHNMIILITLLRPLLTKHCIFKVTKGYPALFSNIWQKLAIF